MSNVSERTRTVHQDELPLSLFIGDVTIEVPTPAGITSFAVEVEERLTDRGRIVVRISGSDAADLTRLTGATVTAVVSRTLAAPLVATAVVDRVLPGDPVRLVLRRTTPWRPRQRREAVRLDIVIRPQSVARITPDGEEPIDARIIDLSATGVRLESATSLDRGERLHLVFSLPTTPTPFDTVVEVMHCQERPDGLQRPWQLGCRFVDLDKRVSEAIFRFIFEEQRRRLRRRRDH